MVQPVFDTQIAAALAGHPSQVGYAELVRRLLGVELAKAHTRADWSRRPLSAEQQEYALDDVRHLGGAARELVRDARGEGPRWPGSKKSSRRSPIPTRCASRPKMRGRRSRACPRSIRSASSSRRRSPRGANAAPSNATGRAAGFSTTCRLREIVLRLPRSPEALLALPEMQESVVRKCGEELLALVRDAGIGDPPPPLPRRERPDPAQLALVKRLADVAAEVAKGLEINAEVLATRRELEKLAAGRRDISLLRGWRKDVVGEKLASGALTCGARGARQALRLARRPCARQRLRGTLRGAAGRPLRGLRLAAHHGCARAPSLSSSPPDGAWPARFLRRLAAGFADREHVEQPLRDLLERAFGAHGAQQPRIRVVRQHRLGLPRIDAKPLGDRGFLVVLALEQLVLGAVRHAVRRRTRRRRGVDVEHLVAQRAGAPAGDAPHQFLVAHFEQHHRIERRAEVVHEPGEGFGLRLRARETIEDESASAHRAARRDRE